VKTAFKTWVSENGHGTLIYSSTMKEHKFNRIRQVAPMCLCPDERAHWRQLENTIEPSVYGGSAVKLL